MSIVCRFLRKPETKTNQIAFGTEYLTLVIHGRIFCRYGEFLKQSANVKPTMFGYKLWCANVPLSYLSAFTLHKRSTHNANAKVTVLHNMALNQGQVLILFINYHNYLDDYDMLLLAENFFNTFTFTEQGSPKNRPLKGNL